MSEKKTKKAMLIGFGAMCAYSFIKGDGIFNKPRFYPQYKAAQKYVYSIFPNANLGGFVKTKNGWTAVINNNGTTYLLSMERSKKGEYVFNHSLL